MQDVLELVDGGLNYVTRPVSAVGISRGPSASRAKRRGGLRHNSQRVDGLVHNASALTSWRTRLNAEDCEPLSSWAIYCVRKTFASVANYWDSRLIGLAS